jgi:hypothetical protein
VGRQESWLSRVQLHSTDLHHGLKTVGSLFKNAFLTRVPRFLTRFHSCSSAFDSCSQIFDSCSLVFQDFWLVLSRVHSCSQIFDSCSLVLSRVHSCSLVFWLMWSFRTDPYNCGIILTLPYSFWNHARFEQSDWLKIVRLQPKSHYFKTVIAYFEFCSHLH